MLLFNLSQARVKSYIYIYIYINKHRRHRATQSNRDARPNNASAAILITYLYKKCNQVHDDSRSTN